MTTSLFSPHWHRISQQQPRLRTHVRVRRQHWRGQHWYILSDETTNRQHRINESAYQFLGRCDGTHTVHEIWSASVDDRSDAAPTQDEVIQLLTQLNEQELLQSSTNTDTEGLFRRRDDRKQKRKRMLVNPFSFRLPLLNPNAWLQKFDPLTHALFHQTTFWLWLAGILLTLLAAGANTREIVSFAHQHTFTPGFLAMLMVCFPVIKTLHELGHALAVRHWGGEVHEAGVALLALIPAPYVDASAATNFPLRRQRIMVSAVGIMIELALAALAFWVWSGAQPGLVQDTAFAVMFIGTISTLTFNANPLLRFDGYYVMCDLLDLPNLGNRSNAYWSYLGRRFLLRAPVIEPVYGTGECKWLVCYAPLSLIYRLLIALAIILWLGGKWMLLGLAVTLYLIISMLIKPLLNWSRLALSSAQPGAEYARVRLHLAVAAGGLLFLLCGIPLPFSTVAPAIVWLPEQAQVRPEVDGFIQTIVAKDGETVKAGQLLAVLENRELQTQHDQLLSRLEGLRADQYQLMLSDPSAAENIAQDLQRTEAELARSQENLAKLQLHAQAEGTLVLPYQSDLPGTFTKQGTVLGYVLAKADLRVRCSGRRRRLSGTPPYPASHRATF